MKLIWRAGLFIIALKGGGALNDELELKKLYAEMWRALIAKNIPTLEKIHAAGFVLVHMTGRRQPKEEYLRSVREGVLNYFSERAENIFVDVRAGKLIGQSRVEAAVFGGGRGTWRLQLDFDVEKIDGAWVLKFARASTY